MSRACRVRIYVIVAAAASWLLVAWGIVAEPAPTSAWRLAWFAALTVAAITTGPLVLIGMVEAMVRRHPSLLDVRLAVGAGYRVGVADAERRAREERPDLRAVN